jgi:energy-converting hydrogenase A subunit R
VSIAERVGVAHENVFSTDLPLDFFKRTISNVESICEPWPDDAGDAQIDRFFTEGLHPRVKVLMDLIEVVGGRRKTRPIYEILKEENIFPSEVVAVGDSITDWHMLSFVEQSGGLAIAWNANIRALPYATCAVAAINARAIKPLLEAFRQGGRYAVEQLIRALPEPKDPEGPYYHWLDGVHDTEEILNIHGRIREICRGRETAALV